jgi:hypothetical protein
MQPYKFHMSQNMFLSVGDTNEEFIGEPMSLQESFPWLEQGYDSLMYLEH